MNKCIVGLTGLIILLIMNVSIWQKEQHIASGKIINLALAPVDPRSIMQGDYMTLRYHLGNKISTALALKQDQHQTSISPSALYVVVQVDENNVASFVSLDSNAELLTSQLKLQYRLRNNGVLFATDAFFFAEGDGDIFSEAKYGQFRVNDKGELLLVDMLNDNFELLRSSAPKKGS